MKVMIRAARLRAKITEKGRAIEVETYQLAVGNGRHYDLVNRDMSPP